MKNARFPFTPTFAAVLASTALLSGCNGDDDTIVVTPPPQTQVIQGTAAVGAALSQALVSITDTSGGAVCAEPTIMTSGTGDFSCTVLEGKAAPFLVVVTDPSGAYSPMVSVATRTPTAGAPLTVNASPLTSAIVGKLSPDGNPLSVAASPSLMNVTALQAITAKVLLQLAEVLGKLGAPAGYDPFSTPIVAATASLSGNTADQIIDLLKINSVNGVTTISTIDNPDAAVALAGAADAAPAVLPSPSTAAITLSEAIKLLSASLNRCFALPAASRVLSKDDSILASAGGREVTAVAAACEDITHPKPAEPEPNK